MVPRRLPAADRPVNASDDGIMTSRVATPVMDAYSASRACCVIGAGRVLSGAAGHEHLTFDLHDFQSFASGFGCREPTSNCSPMP